MGLALPSSQDPTDRWTADAVEDPLRLIKLAVAAILLFATVISVLLTVTGVVPRAIVLVGICWALYGFIVAMLDGVLEPLIDGFARLLVDAGLQRTGAGYSGIESLVASGHYEAAAEEYRERAQESASRTEATLRRAALLAGPLKEPETAAAELDSLRSGETPMDPESDIRVGLALVQLYEISLDDPGRAMTELRRLIDRYPSTRRMRQLRIALAQLKQERFGNPS